MLVCNLYGMSADESLRWILGETIFVWKEYALIHFLCCLSWEQRITHTICGHSDK